MRWEQTLIDAVNNSQGVASYMYGFVIVGSIGWLGYRALRLIEAKLRGA
jgi:hypothetical protein